MWSNSAGKACPTDNFTHALPEIYSRAQIWINFHRNPPPD